MPLRADMASVVGADTTPGQTSTLQIRLADAGKAVVEANSSLNGYAIVVTDAAGLPLAGVAVALRLPDDGATGYFVDGAHSAVAYTDVSGVAKFPQVHWGSALGTAAVRVTAVKGEVHAGALIEQTIVAHSAGTPSPSAQVKAPSAKVALPDPSGVQTTNPSTPVPPTPGTPTSVSAVHSGASSEQNAPVAAQTPASTEPAVTVVNAPGVTGASHGGSSKKWVILALVAAGAGAGIAVALAGHGGGAAAAQSSGLSIGTPSISVGH